MTEKHERFYSKVDVRGPDDCWVYEGPTDHSGYGLSSGEGLRGTAHRVAWSLAHGPIPEGAHICHRCDTPSCVNPSHLYAGTNQTNRDDAKRNGTLSRGQEHSAILREAWRRKAFRRHLYRHEVQAIRRRYREGETTHELAEAFKVSQATIFNILHGRVWTNIPDEGPLPPPPRRQQAEARMATALRYAKRYRRIDSRLFSAVCPGWHQHTLLQDLKELVRRGRLRCVGYNRGWQFVPVG